MPERWIAEAARLLRPGGRLVFLANSPLLIIFSAADSVVASERRERPQFGLHRVEWDDDDGPSSSSTSPRRDDPRPARARLRGRGAARAARARGASTRYEYVTPEWARQWPCEEIWVAGKRVE